MNNYWSKKESNKEKARAHTQLMENNYAFSIQASVEDSKIYDDSVFGNISEEIERKIPSVVFANVGTAQAISIPSCRGKIAVLNFASFKNAGGMFINGSNAQEECLCHGSDLYNVLQRFTNSYYKDNVMDNNRCLYRNRGLYCPNIIFDQGTVDVITVAAPNYKAASRYYKVSKSENEKALRSRIEFIKAIAEDQGVDTLILGAYGCGVFGQDPALVARIFDEVFSETSIDTIVYAVPGSDRNAQVFCQYFGENQIVL